MVRYDREIKNLKRGRERLIEKIERIDKEIAHIEELKKNPPLPKHIKRHPKLPKEKKSLSEKIIGSIVPKEENSD